MPELLPTPLLVVMSAPSGAGKSTLCRYLRETFGNLAYSVSCTTRAPRGTERHGESYFFLSDDEFARRVAAGEFLESALVHGNRYGTLKATVLEAMGRGDSVLMDIDVQGAAQIRAALGRDPALRVPAEGFVDIFISPPSLDILRRRLEARGEDAPATIDRRLRNAETELAQAGAYRFKVVNDDLAAARDAVAAILRREAGRPRRGCAAATGRKDRVR